MEEQQRKEISMTCTIKQCSKCNEVKDLSEFWPNEKGRLGVESRCKACRKDYQLTRGQARREYFLIYNSPEAKVARLLKLQQEELNNSTISSEDK